MPTAGQLVDNIVSELHGYGNTADRVTSLAAPIAPGDTTFTVTDASGQAVGLSPGVVEIDSELLYAKTVDQATGIVTLASGFGRGYKGTTAASHATGVPVVSQPKFPRSSILKTINQVIGAVAPDIFSVQTETMTVTYPSNTYTPVVPRGLSVLDVQWQHPIGDWLPIFSYGVDPFDGKLRLGSLPSAIAIGRPLRVVWAGEPTLFSTEADDFVTVTGLPVTCSDVIELGVLARMVPGLDISRAQLTSVEQSDRSRVVPPNAGINVGKYLMSEFMDRLKNESITQRRQYPPRMRRRFS